MKYLIITLLLLTSCMAQRHGIVRVNSFQFEDYNCMSTYSEEMPEKERLFLSTPHRFIFHPNGDIDELIAGEHYRTFLFDVEGGGWNFPSAIPEDGRFFAYCRVQEKETKHMARLYKYLDEIVIYYDNQVVKHFKMKCK